ncbi:MAG: response regulator [Clostridia bacterium]|nr:response regulator [Clostridia bacterium]
MDKHTAGYEYELKLRKELIRDSFLYFRVNLTTGDIEEYVCKADDDGDSKIGINANDYIESFVVTKIYPEDVENVRRALSPNALLEAYQRGDKSASVTYRRLVPSMEYHWVRMSAIMMERQSDHSIVAFLHDKDIDSEKKAKHAIETILNEDIELVITVNVKTGIGEIAHILDHVNYYHIESAFDFKEVFDRYTREVVFEEDREAYAEFNNIAYMTEQLLYSPTTTFFYRVIENGVVRRKITKAYYLDERKNYLVLTRRDVTDLYEGERRKRKELQMAIEKAIRSNHTKSEFLSHMSHDIRTPLNAILAFSNKDLVKEANETQLREYMNKVNLSGEYLLGIINDILDMSRMEQKRIKLNLEPYYLSEFERSIRNVIETLCEHKNIEFEMDTSRSGITGIIADHMRLNQIFINLLTNAVKFTQPNGKIELIIEQRERIGENRYIKRFIVQDNGIGMSKEFLPYAFDSFHQEHRRDNPDRTQGTGLGLSIVKELVDLMNGTIQVESVLNHGTTFTIDIPFEGIYQYEKKQKSKEYDYHILKGHRVLIVEDDDISAEIVKVFLERIGCLVERTENGESALNLFEQSPIGYYDLILMDIRMPVMDGIVTTKAIRAMRREDADTVTIIAMTADAFSEDEQLSYGAGMNAHLPKPIDPEKLYDTCCSFLVKQ